MIDPPAFDPLAVRGIIFDLDGTLVDSYHAIADSLNHARKRYDLPALSTADVRREVGHGLEQLIADLVGPDRVADGVRLFRSRYAQVFREKTRMLPGVGPALARLDDAGLSMAVASNKPAYFSEPILEQLGIRARFRTVEGPDRVGATKPDPRMLRTCLGALGTAPLEALYVGDMDLDVESAARAGVPVVLVAGGSRDRNELEATGQRVLDSLEELSALLDR